MAHPAIKLMYNSTANDVEYLFSAGGNSDGVFYPVVSGSHDGTIVFTGGGIDDVFDGDPNGSRSATIRPESGFTVVPKTFIERSTVSGGVLDQVPLAGPLNNRYVFAVHVDGTTTSELYLEAWDDTNHVTCNSAVLSGTVSNGHVSMIRAITTTTGYPGTDWSGTPLRGYGSRIGLYDNQYGFTDEVLYFNIYIKIPFDTVTFVSTPILSLRYLYS